MRNCAPHFANGTEDPKKKEQKEALNASDPLHNNCEYCQHIHYKYVSHLDTTVENPRSTS